MRIALGQLNMVWEDKELSLQKAEKLMEQASAQKADILFFPEMSFTGFSMNLAKIGESGEASDTVRQMKELAVRYKMAVGFGWAALPEPGQGKGTNRFTLADGVCQAASVPVWRGSGCLSGRRSIGNGTVLWTPDQLVCML